MRKHSSCGGQEIWTTLVWEVYVDVGCWILIEQKIDNHLYIRIVKENLN